MPAQLSMVYAPFRTYMPLDLSHLILDTRKTMLLNNRTYFISVSADLCQFSGRKQIWSLSSTQLTHMLQPMFLLDAIGVWIIFSHFILKNFHWAQELQRYFISVINFQLGWNKFLKSLLFLISFIWGYSMRFKIFLT